MSAGLASTLQRRLALIKEHLVMASEGKRQFGVVAAGSSSSSALNADDVVLVAAVRTPIGRGRRGTLKNTPPDKLLQPLFEHVMSNELKEVDPRVIGDIIVGTVLPPGGFGATQVRVASLLAGIPQEVPCCTVNRQCSSGLQAIVNGAANIRAGIYDVALCGGVESMSLNWGQPPDLSQINQDAMGHESARGCYMSMGMTSEEVAKRYKITRTQQDQVAVDSHRKMNAAQEAGRFVDEIVPIKARVEDAEGNEKEVVLKNDEGCRPNTTLEGLAKLRPAFDEDGSTTAGNASQVSDGAALTVVTTRAFANKHKLPILGRIVSAATVGVEPAIMGVGPAYAIPKALEKAGLKAADIDLFEINEAFASQFLFSCQHLDLPLSKVNVNGGAIALGHPLGCTGARMTATLLHELRRRQQRLGVVSMCIGSGMGMAAVFEAEF